MLKVVGASWLQTRISTYILVAVGLLGIGVILLGEFGHVEKDGIYSATVSWNRKGGYRIDFWGQGNNLREIPLKAARAYYKASIFDHGWSIIEIETSSKYPDTVQAYAAGLLEGSLTWQLIHHHWVNTAKAGCERRPAECEKLMRNLRENSAAIRERADQLDSTDSFWHMVKLFYAQLDGLEAGWKHAVRRSRQSAEMEPEDFLWLAMAADLPNLEYPTNGSNSHFNTDGMVFLKALAREKFEPLVALGHNTAAPYTKMLRLLKRYKFGYRILPISKSSEFVPTRSIVMSSYPGALSSHDELYVVNGDDRELIVAGTPMKTVHGAISKDQVLSPVRIMAANHLANDGQSWSQRLAYLKGSISQRQWVTYEPRTSVVWVVEQSTGITHAADYTKRFMETTFLVCTGVSLFQEPKNSNKTQEKNMILQRENIARIQVNVTTMEHVRGLMRGFSQESVAFVDVDQESLDLKLSQILAYRGDKADTPTPFGVIDTKILAADDNGLADFEATSGPVKSPLGGPFEWSKTFPNISHIGHPNIFNFDSLKPFWVWI